MLVVLGVPACGAQQPAPEPPKPTPPRDGSAGYALPDTPFTRKGSVVTATCLLGGRFAGVSVQAWESEHWTLLDQRNFDIPTDAAFSNPPGDTPVNSALVDLCRQRADTPSPYPVDSLESTSPRIRALFDLGFTRMAVVLRDPAGNATHAGFVTSDALRADQVPLSDAAGDDEQNAVLAPDGRSVWFTYTAPSGEQRIGSRAVDGDHRLSDEGPAAGPDLPLVVSGKPPRAIQAEMVHVSPDGGRFAGKAPEVFGNVFDVPGASTALTGASARHATLVRNCVGIVGWIDDAHVLCRTPSGGFQSRDARSGNAAGKPIGVADKHDGTVAEGLLMSPDGQSFVASLHVPNDPYGVAGERPDFRVVSTTPGGHMIGLGDHSLTPGTAFLQWW